LTSLHANYAVESRNNQPDEERTALPQKHKLSIALIALLLVIWGILTIRVDARWYGIQEAPRIWVPAAIRNYHEYGLKTTGLMVIRDVQPTTPENFEYYSHHPPTIIWLPALFTEALGFNELAVRIGFIYATLLSAALFYVLVRRLYDARLAIWATAFYGLTPVTAYYGRVPAHDLLGLVVIFAFAAILVNWLHRPTRARLIALIILAWMAVWTAWTAIFFVGTLGLAGMWLGNKSQRRAIVGFGVVTIIAFIALMGFYQLQWSGSIDSILDAFVWRASNASDDPGTASFTIFQFIAVTLAHTMVLVSIGVFIKSVGGIFALRKRRWDIANIFTLALFMGGLIYQLVFRNASYVHDYYKLMFIPSIAIAAAAFWVYAHQRPRKRILRPIVDGLLIVSVLMSVAVLFIMHHSGHRPWITAVTDWINANANDEDRIMTHLVGKDNMMPLRFYTYRVIDEGVDFADAQQIAADASVRVIYIYCPTIDSTDTLQITGDYQTIPADECQLILLDQ
jgi:hypothetical protein